MDHDEIDRTAEKMSDEDQLRHILSRGWKWLGFGYMPPPEPQGIIHASPGGVVFDIPSGVYSLSTAVRESMAREDQDGTPDQCGRYYHGPVPEKDPYRQLTISDERFDAIVAEYDKE